MFYFSRREAETIVRASKKHGLFGKEYVWILTRSAMGDLDGTRGTSPRAPEDYPMGLLGKSGLNTAVQSQIAVSACFTSKQIAYCRLAL